MSRLGRWFPPQRTPLDLTEAAALVESVLGASGITSPEALRLALAQLDVETGGFRSMWNWNPGNVKLGESSHDYTTIKLNERNADGSVTWYAPEGQLAGKDGPIVGERYSVPPGHPQTRIRAYQSPREGVEAWLSTIQAPRYAGAVEALKRGDADGFLAALKRGGYFTATLGEYKAALSDRLKNWTISSAVASRARNGESSGGFALVLVGALVGSVVFLSKRKAKGARRGAKS